MKKGLIRLSWDSEFFGFEVARWSPSHCSEQALSCLVNEARNTGVQLVYLFIPPDARFRQFARDIGATLLDRKVTYRAKVAKRICSNDPHVHPTTLPTERLRSLALQSGGHSRFKIDPRLPPDSFERMFTLWLTRSLAGDIAREVLIFREGAEELGFVTLGVKNVRVHIGLLAVHSDARRRGVGTALVNAAFARAATWGSDEIQVVTQQENVDACRLYERCGFIEAAVEYVYHLWL